MLAGENCFKADGIGKSTSAEECGAEINRFFLKDISDILLSAGGGETMCEDLSFVDFSAIAAAPPKWFMGFSDNTNLTFLLPTLCDTAAVYGPNFPALFQEHPAILDAWGLLTGRISAVKNYEGWESESLRTAENPLAPYHITEPFSMGCAGKSLPAPFSGRLLGGCLDCLINLCGTRFDAVRAFNRRYAKDGVVWFLEACDLNPMGVRRGLWQLKEAGWFENAAGFLIGRPCRYTDSCFGNDCNEAALDMLVPLGRPVLYNLDIGHLPPMMPLIAGALATVTPGADGLRIYMRQS